MELREALLLLLAGCGAGLMNSLAGGGTLLTYPALLEVGLTPTVANATSTVALWPGSLAGYWGFRSAIGPARLWLFRWLLPSLLGGLLGAYLLLWTPERRFAELAPWLILFATLLFGFGQLSTRSPETQTNLWARGRLFSIGSWLAQLGVATYGGYFGAGIGILMLGLLAAAGMTEIHAANGIKNLLAASINGVAAAVFLVEARVAWVPVGYLLTGALLGGWIGPRLGLRLGPESSRWLVVGVGVVVTLHLFVKLR